MHESTQDDPWSLVVAISAVTNMKSVLKSILAFLACASPVFAASSPEALEHNLYRLTDADAQRARDVIAAGDSPRLLSESFGCRPRLKYDRRTGTILQQLIEQDRIECFVSFLPRVRFERRADWRLGRLFEAAAKAHRFEICDYLLSTQRFVARARGLRGLHGWETGALRRLLGGHPDLLEQLAPDVQGLAFSSDAEAILRDLGVIECCRGVSAAFAEEDEEDYAPSSLLSMVVQNPNLDDAGMARVLEGLLAMGAVVEAALVEDFRGSHPDYDSCNWLLCECLEPQAKEPGAN